MNLYSEIKPKEIRIRLYGKRATEKEIIDEIVRLHFGNLKKQQKPLGYSEIARKMGITRPTVYHFRKLAIKQGKIELDQYENEILPVETESMKAWSFYNTDEFVQDELIKDWVKDLLTRKNGKPVKIWRSKVSMLRSICNTLKIKPKQLLVDHDTTKTIMQNLVIAMKEGKLIKEGPGNVGRLIQSGNIESQLYPRRMAVRDFCGFYHMTWQRGVGGVLSGKIVGHGKYADIRLSKEEYETADKYLKEKYGIDSDEFRIFWLGIESCSRFKALISMPLEWTKHQNKTNNKVTFFMSAFESKTEEINQGKWVKYITRPDLQQSLETHKAKPEKYPYIWTSNNGNGKEKTMKILKDNLRELYRFLGKTNPVFNEHPIHVLRHIGAHYWLEKKDYNYALVAKIGGWITVDELRRSYGEMPPEKVIELIERQD